MPHKLLYHGHSTLEIHTGPHRILFDPFFSSNPLADVKADAVNPTHIFLSHAHFDHTEDVVPIAKRTSAQVLCCFEMANYLEKQGLKNLHPMNHGGGATLPFGRATMTVAFHTSSWPDGTPGGTPAGWILQLQNPNKTLYFAGDTALFGDMKLLAELFTIDLACLPIGDNFTMGPAHAIKAAQFLNAKSVLPLHYNTWPPIAQDPQKFAADLHTRTGIKPHPLKPGESIDI
ncbi:MAG TPA: metal-dependent hydrolase [Phycisphaerae bacterium]|nr:metal-dependent hydrolase [Phycisphaerae bacterium]